jgi:omega-6 fatty acid desaturase (delta-12 desaturase)
MEQKTTTKSASSFPQWRSWTWQKAVAKYQRPAIHRSVWQLANTLIPYLGLWALMIWSFSISYWLTLPLLLLAAGFLVRIFIISHDCGHGSFFRSRKANDFWGSVTGVLTFTPYFLWRYEHAVHHATSGDLDRRGLGDIWTLTVQEYIEASRWKRFAYRLGRNPFVLFVLAPLWLFLIQHRFAPRNAGERERKSVYWTNRVLLLIALGLCLTIGFKAYFLIQLPLLMIAAATGVWLFYVQHQFEGVYWERGDDWDYVTAAIKGSSYYKLPRVLQWFTGSIGFHHIHHLSPNIPNYNLERCHKADAMFQQANTITLLSSLRSFTFRLWDERRRKLVGYSELRKHRLEQAANCREQAEVLTK